jgi:hypothetical protein
MLLLMLLMMREEIDWDEGCLGVSYTDITLPMFTRIDIIFVPIFLQIPTHGGFPEPFSTVSVDYGQMACSPKRIIPLRPSP